MEKITLVPATKKEYPILQNMGRFYVYDMTEYMGEEKGWEIPADGLYECTDFKKYWEAEGSFPFLIKRGKEIVGFVIVDKKGSDEKVDFNMAQFFILRKFQGRGVGQKIAHDCFDQFQGTWEVMVMPKNEGAYQFWKKVIGSYTHNQFEPTARAILLL